MQVARTINRIFPSFHPFPSIINLEFSKNIIVVGPRKSGKTSWIKKLVYNQEPSEIYNNISRKEDIFISIKKSSIQELKEPF